MRENLIAQDRHFIVRNLDPILSIHQEKRPQISLHQHQGKYLTMFFSLGLNGHSIFKKLFEFLVVKVSMPKHFLLEYGFNGGKHNFIVVLCITCLFH